MGVARASVHVDGEAARALLLNGMERVSATGGTIGFMLEVGALAEEVCVRRRGRGWLMAVQRPLQLGTINVLSVEGASLLLRGFEGPTESRLHQMEPTWPGCGQGHHTAQLGLKLVPQPLGYRVIEAQRFRDISLDGGVILDAHRPRLASTFPQNSVSLSTNGNKYNDVL